MAAPSVLLEGVVFGESPRWHDGRLWFADWCAREVVAVDLGGHREVVHRPEVFPFSIDWLPDGRLLVLSDGLQRREPDGTFVAHAELAHLGRGWNELVVDGRGHAYVNRAGFDLMGGAEPTSGTVALVRPDGSSELVAEDVWFPNGMVVTPDGRTLVVAESYRSRLTAFDVGVDGGLSGRRVWAELGTAVPDGTTLDAEGAIWFADVPHQQCVRVAEGGAVLATVPVDRGCFSCSLGGPDGRTLFVVATRWNGPAAMFAGPPSGQVLTLEVDVPGAGFP